jgi:sulfate transport system permease protein
MGITLTYLSALLLIPLAACVLKTTTLTPAEFWETVWSERARAAYALTFGTSAAAALLNAIIGLLLAWVLVRYDFPGRGFLDALIDLPFALPTSVAGLVYSALFVEQGWYGQFLVPLGIQGAYSRLAIVFVLVFVSLPFAVRTVQPVLESLEEDLEEAAASLGASRWQTFRLVLVPVFWPAVLTGFALSFARGLGEYGSVIFVSGNMPLRTEIAPVLIVARLEEFSYPQASAIALVLVMGSLLSLLAINWLDRRSQTHAR